jgi:hypothetical protein
MCFDWVLWLLCLSPPQQVNRQDVPVTRCYWPSYNKRPTSLRWGKVDHVILLPTSDTQITSHIGLIPTHTTTKPASQQPVTQDPEPVPIWWLMGVKHPSKALLRSQASERDINDAAGLERDWATANTLSGILSTYVNSTAFETITTQLPEPENFWLPNSYSEAMSWPDIWSGPIEKELKVMKDRNV